MVFPMDVREPTLLDSMLLQGQTTTNLQTIPGSNSDDDPLQPLIKLLRREDLTHYELTETFLKYQQHLLPTDNSGVSAPADRWSRQLLDRLWSSSRNGTTRSTLWCPAVLEWLVKSHMLSSRHGSRPGQWMRLLLVHEDYRLINIALIIQQDFNERDLVQCIRWLVRQSNDPKTQGDMEAHFDKEQQDVYPTVTTEDNGVNRFMFPFSRKELGKQLAGHWQLDDDAEVEWTLGEENILDFWLRLVMTAPCTDALLSRAVKVCLQN